jgi:hypothetical protein
MPMLRCRLLCWDSDCTAWCVSSASTNLPAQSITCQQHAVKQDDVLNTFAIHAPYSLHIHVGLLAASAICREHHENGEDNREDDVGAQITLHRQNMQGLCSSKAKAPKLTGRGMHVLDCCTHPKFVAGAEE